MSETCETCRFWERVSAYDGWCKRRAPRVFVFSSAHTDIVQYETQWPATKATERACGEHAPAKTGEGE